MSDFPDHVLSNLHLAIEEAKRLESLSNEELVREYLRLGDDADETPYTEEMMGRLYPGWIDIEL